MPPPFPQRIEQKERQVFNPQSSWMTWYYILPLRQFLARGDVFGAPCNVAASHLTGICPYKYFTIFNCFHRLGTRIEAGSNPKLLFWARVSRSSRTVPLEAQSNLQYDNIRSRAVGLNRSISPPMWISKINAELYRGLLYSIPCALMYICRHLFAIYLYLARIWSSSQYLWNSARNEWGWSAC